MTNYKLNSVVWEITWKCNANCIHCGSDCISKEKPNQLTTGECLEIIKDLYRIGAKKVTLSGGECLLQIHELKPLIKKIQAQKILYLPEK